MCWPTSLGIEIHLHSPAVGSAFHCPYLVLFTSVALGESLGSIFNRGWLGWCLREKRAQKTLHHLHALQLWVSYWGMEGERA